MRVPALPLDPSATEWSSTKPHRGRGFTIKARLWTPRQNTTPVIVSLSGSVARRLQDDLKYHACQASTDLCPYPIRRSILGVTLEDISSHSRRQTKRLTVDGERIKITASPQAAAMLLGDLLWCARGAQRKPTELMQSRLWRFLEFAVAGGRESRRTFIQGCVEDGILSYGQWIREFADRVTRTPLPSGKDKNLLTKVLAEARRLGYQEADFFSQTRKHPKLLKWPLQAFLVEYCLGGPASWKQVNLTPPFQLMKRELSRRRARHQRKNYETGITGFYRKYVTGDWRSRLKKSHLRSQEIPLPLARLLKSHR